MRFGAPATLIGLPPWIEVGFEKRQQAVVNNHILQLDHCTDKRNRPFRGALLRITLRIIEWDQVHLKQCRSNDAPLQNAVKSLPNGAPKGRFSLVLLRNYSVRARSFTYD